MATQLTPILETIKEILKPAGLKGMHVDEIAAAAVATNQNLGLSLEDYSKRASAALAGNLKLKTQKPSFARVEGAKEGRFKKGWYRVKVERTASSMPSVEPPETEKAYLGKAGELAVMSELLFWGYNASAMLVDSGIDLVASKDGKYFHIQVKTSTNNGDKFYFTIRNSIFQQNNNSSTFYVFVLRQPLDCAFVIIPSNYIQALLSAGKISNGPSLSISITVDEKRQRYMLNGSVDVGIYVGNFGNIK